MPTSRATARTSTLLLLAACGGGGGGTATVTTPVRLVCDPVELPIGVTDVDLLVELDVPGGAAPVLAQATVQLPAALTVTGSDPLRAAQAVATLDGHLTGDRYAVLVGDARNAAAAPLPKGPLFRLRLTATAPRRPGMHLVQLVDLRAAANDGAPLATGGEPVTVPVTIR